MTAVWIIIALAVVVVIWVIMTYNRLVGLRAIVRRSPGTVSCAAPRRVFGFGQVAWGFP